MSKNRHQKQFIPVTKNSPKVKINVGAPTPPQASSMLDVMEDGREFISLLGYQYINLNIANELHRSIQEIAAIRKRPVVCYLSNVVKARKTSVIIDGQDALPFNEMIAAIPASEKELDIVLVTPGGFANQVAKFVNVLRPRFDRVGFLVLNQAMSAGTIFMMSGDEIVMRNESYFGPIDPQVKNNSGEIVPAQSLLTLLEDIKVRGEELSSKGKPIPWTDLQILKNLDPKDIGNALSASQYSIQLVEEYLLNFKFKTWTNHSNGDPVTPEERKAKANQIAKLLCDHSKWKNHGHAITREAAWDVCKLKIVNAESIDGLERAMRRMWALIYWIFENMDTAKILASSNYVIFRNDPKEDKKII